jgi:hypothetical protein
LKNTNRFAYQLKVKSKDALYKGKLVAEVLSGSWRCTNVPALHMTEAELDAVTPLLYDSGTAALAWHRLKQTSLRTSSSADLLHQAYRLQSLQAEIHEQKIEKLFRLFRQAKVEGLLAKGWATASMYSEKALRPYGDLDVCVRPEQYKLATAVLNEPEANDCWVDLHKHFSEIDDRTVDQLFARSRTVSLKAEQIRILCPEDQLALSCIHMLKHGAWRPLWLCDIGVTVETLPANFDWDLCLGTSNNRANWIGCAIGLAKRLLAVDTGHLPVSLNLEPPAWLIDNVLWQWHRPFAINQPPMSHPIPMTDLFRHPTDLFAGLRQRWPNPIIATISVNGEFNNLPRLPYQMANCISRIGRLLFASQNGLTEH